MTQIDDSDKPAWERYVLWSGVARLVAMAEAIVPQPTKPALIGCRVVGGDESSSPSFNCCFLAVDIVA